MRQKCPACGRTRKPSHEKKCGTPKTYSPDCVGKSKFSMKDYKAVIKERKDKADKEISDKAAADKAAAEATLVSEAEKAALAEESMHTIEEPVAPAVETPVVNVSNPT